MLDSMYKEAQQRIKFHIWWNLAIIYTQAFKCCANTPSVYGDNSISHVK